MLLQNVKLSNLKDFLKLKLVPSALLFFSFTISAQIQLGADIIGPVSGDNYGEQVRMSSNGNVLAVLGDINASGGSVRVYENNGGDWVLYGTDSMGNNFGDMAANSISLSYDGNTIAIGGSGLARIFTYDSGIWTQKGADIVSTTSNSSFGTRISLSSDGNIVAISTPDFNPQSNGTTIPPPIYFGLVQVFKYEAGNWVQSGDDIIGMDGTESLGEEISLSADGNNLAAAGILTLRVYENLSGVWTIKGSEIDEPDSNPSVISLSDDGSTVAIGDPDYSDEISTRGRTRVYKFEMNDWNQFGNDILGEESFARSGRSLSISPDGEVVVIGSVGNFSGTISPGRVQIFTPQGNLWSQIGQSTTGDEVGDHFGDSVSISANGSRLAVGAQYSDVNGFESGYVRVFELGGLLSDVSVNYEEMKLYPNPTNGPITVKLTEGTELQEIQIFNAIGALVKSFDTHLINLIEFPSGVYFTKVRTSKGVDTRVIIKD